jgi:hypothetical protein
MAGMTIPLPLEYESIVDPLLLENTETMDHLLVLVYVTMMTIEERLHHLRLNETGLLLLLILGVVILRWTRLIVVMAPHRHPPMTVMNGGQTRNIRQLMLSLQGQGRVPLRGQGKIMTESHPEITLNIVVLQRRRAMHPSTPVCRMILQLPDTGVALKVLTRLLPRTMDIKRMDMSLGLPDLHPSLHLVEIILRLVTIATLLNQLVTTDALKKNYLSFGGSYTSDVATSVPDI